MLSEKQKYLGYTSFTMVQHVTILGDARGYGKRAAAAAIALDWLVAEPHRDLTAADKENATDDTASIVRRDFHATPAIVQHVGTTIDGYLRNAALTVPVHSKDWVKGALAAWRSSMKACTWMRMYM